MVTADEAAHLTEAVREALAGSGPHRGAWPEGVRIEHVQAAVEDDTLVLRIGFSDARCPGETLGAAFQVGDTYWVENGGVLDAEWASSHAVTYFGEATFAGDPCTWAPDRDGVRWYRDRLP